MDAVPAGIALGANLGDRAAHLRDGLTFLATLAADGTVRASRVIETEPVDCPPGSPAFLNTAAVIAYAGTARALLEALQGFERLLGRAAPGERAVNAPRPLDLDILFFGDAAIDEPGLVVPHPRLAQRRFVLEPLAELEPDRVLPGFSLPVAALLRKLSP